ncbi:MAG: sugar transferase [Chloroflexi bacterium]|nr:sugar transferase [Chloroflexota bacterium]
MSVGVSSSRPVLRLHTFRYRLLWLAIDVVLINVAFVAGYLLRYQLQLFRDIQFDASLASYSSMQALFTASLLLFFWTDNVYTVRNASWFDQMSRIVGATIKMPFVLWTAIFIVGPSVYSRLMILQAALVLLLLLGAARAVKRVVEARMRARGMGVSNLLIAGAGELGRAVMRTVFARPDLGYRCVGFVDDDPQRGQTDIGRFPALGETKALAELIHQHAVDEVVVTLPWNAQSKILGIVHLCEQLGVTARVVPSILQINYSQIDVNDFGGIPVLGIRGRTIGPVNRMLKRAFDLVLGATISLASLPLVALAATAVRLESPGPAIFTQMRAGANGKPFRIFKLRSMHVGAEEERKQLEAMNEADGPLFKIKDDPRVTRVGRIIRKLSIDEFPQFWNVLRGEMSIVGPRPALLTEVAEYDDWHRERLRIKPGITGLWQISGRSELKFEEMVLLDVYYIDNWSLLQDLTIMLRTVPYLLTSKGAY